MTLNVFNELSAGTLDAHIPVSPSTNERENSTMTLAQQPMPDLIGYSKVEEAAFRAGWNAALNAVYEAEQKRFRALTCEDEPLPVRA